MAAAAPAPPFAPRRAQPVSPGRRVPDDAGAQGRRARERRSGAARRATRRLSGAVGHADARRRFATAAARTRAAPAHPRARGALPRLCGGARPPGGGGARRPGRPGGGQRLLPRGDRLRRLRPRHRLLRGLTAAHPGSAYALLNYGYAYVDKIPSAGAITRVILANTAVTLFSQAIELEPSWLALYTRGNSYLYWPKVFGRAPLAVADLERAVAMGKAHGQQPYHVRAWIALGDAYWKIDQLERARATWEEALRRFPGEPRLVARLARQGDELAALIDGELDPDKRVDTDLSVLEEAR